MSKVSEVAQQLVDEARAGHDPTQAQLDRTLDALHQRLDFADAPAEASKRVAAAAAAAIAADVIGTKVASASVGGTLKLILATVALSGTVTTGVWMHASRSAPVTRAPASQVVAAQPRASAQAPQRDAAPEAAPESVETVPLPSEPAIEAPTEKARRPRELQLIGRALARLRDDRPRSALRLLDRHEKHFPDGKLTTERKGLRVLALCAAGRIDEARRARIEFLAEAPRAPIAGRVRSACNEEGSR